jgi:O-antigen/teichoic acid export membrane protein
MRSDFYRAAATRLFMVAATLLAGLLNLRLCAAYFSPAAYGSVLVALQLLAYLPVLDGGFRTAINRRMLAAEGEETGSLLSFGQTLYTWLLGPALLIASLGLVGYGLLLEMRHSGIAPSLPFFLALAGAGTAAFFSQAQINLLLGLGAQASMWVLIGANSLLNVAFLALFLNAGLGVWAFPISLALAAVLIYGAGFFLIRVRCPGITLFSLKMTPIFWQNFHSLRKDAWQVFQSQIAILLLFSIDIVLVGILCSPTDAAIYGLLSRLFTIMRGFLQSFSEAAWPILAKRAHQDERFNEWLLHGNSWIYGLAGGGMAILAAPFIQWYMGAAWRPPALLCWLFVARFLIVGASSPASYFLYGVGDFRSLSRCCNRELLLATILGVLLGYSYGMTGVAIAFLLSTSAGTFVPLFAIYARRRNIHLSQILCQVWLRISLNFGLASLVFYLLKKAIFPTH